MHKKMAAVCLIEPHIYPRKLCIHLKVTPDPTYTNQVKKIIWIFQFWKLKRCPPPSLLTSRATEAAVIASHRGLPKEARQACERWALPSSTAPGMNFYSIYAHCISNT